MAYVPERRRYPISPSHPLMPVLPMLLISLLFPQASHLLMNGYGILATAPPPMYTNPSHNYADSGYFSVTVKAFNNKCPTTSTAQVVHIKPPIAQFTYGVACPNGLQVNFTNESKVNTAVYGPVTLYLELWRWQSCQYYPIGCSGFASLSCSRYLIQQPSL